MCVRHLGREDARRARCAVLGLPFATSKISRHTHTETQLKHPKVAGPSPQCLGLYMCDRCDVYAFPDASRCVTAVAGTRTPPSRRNGSVSAGHGQGRRDSTCIRSQRAGMLANLLPRARAEGGLKLLTARASGGEHATHAARAAVSMLAPAAAPHPVSSGWSIGAVGAVAGRALPCRPDGHAEAFGAHRMISRRHHRSYHLLSRAGKV